MQGGKIRDLLFQLLENEEGVIIKHGTQSRESRRAASHGMHTSKFCLNPAGDTPSACRLFDSIVSLCIPVIVSDSIELPFEDIIDYRKIAIFVESSTALKPGFLVSMLRAITAERILEFQKELNEVRTYAFCLSLFFHMDTFHNKYMHICDTLIDFDKQKVNLINISFFTNLFMPWCYCIF